MMTKIVFRSRASSIYGSGHLRRTEAIVRCLLFYGVLPSDICLFFEADEKSGLEIKSLGVPTKIVAEGISTEKEHQIFSELRANVIVCDLIESDNLRHQRIKNTGAFLVIFSDLGLLCPAADMIICPQILPKIPTPSHDNQKVFYGPKYFVVAKNFQANTMHTQVVSDVATNLLVCLGGHLRPDAHRFMLDTLVHLGNNPFKNQTIIIGRTTNYETYNETVSKLPWAKIIETTNDMQKLLREADLALVAGGFLKYEAGVLGIPAAILSIIEHQDVISSSYAKTKSAIYLGSIDNLLPHDVSESLKKIAHNKKKREKMSKSGMSTIDGQGTNRVTQLLLEKYDV